MAKITSFQNENIKLIQGKIAQKIGNREKFHDTDKKYIVDVMKTDTMKVSPKFYYTLQHSVLLNRNFLVFKFLRKNSWL